MFCTLIFLPSTNLLYLILMATLTPYNVKSFQMRQFKCRPIEQSDSRPGRIVGPALTGLAGVQAARPVTQVDHPQSADVKETFLWN